MNQKITKLLDEYLNKNQHSEYNDVLRKEIIYTFVKKIQKKNKNYLYSTQIELEDDIKNMLSVKDSMRFKKFSEVLKLNIDDKLKSERLLEIYDKLV